MGEKNSIFRLSKLPFVSTLGRIASELCCRSFSVKFVEKSLKVCPPTSYLKLVVSGVQKEEEEEVTANLLAAGVKESL